MRIAPLYREMVRMRARNTVRTTSARARHPGRPSPNPRLTASGAATFPHLRDLPRIHRQRTTRLRDEHVLERDLLRLDVLQGRAVPRHGLDDPRQELAAVVAQHRQLRASLRIRVDDDVPDPADPAQLLDRGGGEDPLEADRGPP